MPLKAKSTHVADNGTQAQRTHIPDTTAGRREFFQASRVCTPISMTAAETKQNSPIVKALLQTTLPADRRGSVDRYARRAAPWAQKSGAIAAREATEENARRQIGETRPLHEGGHQNANGAQHDSMIRRKKPIVREGMGGSG